MVHIIQRGASNINIKIKKNLTTIITLTLIVNIAFIWGNSIISGEASNAISESVKDTIKDIVQSDDKLNVGDTAISVNEDSNIIHNELSAKIDYSILIRKAAHFTEFMTLGIILTFRKLLTGKPQLVTIAFICLAVAVLDEFIQSFSDRTDSIKDVIIDFAGSLTGVAVVLVVYIIIKNVKKTKKKI